MKNKNVLVIGGAGFIGSHLCEELVKNNTVTSLDNYLTGSISNHINGIDYYKGNSSDIDEKCGDLKPDLIFHLGEYSRVETSFDDYNMVIDNNLCQFSKVLEYAKKNNSKLLYSGSSTKFGDSLGGAEASPYAWTKSTNTKHLVNYANWFGLKYAIVYFYNAYGGNELFSGKYATLIGKYLNLFKENCSKLPVVKPGTQKRNFTHFSDIVSALIVVGEKGDGDGYGIGSDESHSVLDVVKYFGLEVEWLEERRGNRLEADLITTKTKELGWKPKVSLEKYVKNKIENQNRK